MKIAEFSVRNSLLVNLLSVLIIIGGLVATVTLRRDAFPPVDFDIVTIRTIYLGAPAEDVEKYVTIPIEKELKGISGIKEMESTSDEGLSTIGITIDPETTDKDAVVTDIKDAVDRVRNLPDGVEEDPIVTELKSKERPILEISLSGPFPENEKRQYADSLEDQLLNVDGVASIQRIGWRDPEFWVEVYPDKLAELHVSMDEIIEALETRNVTLPGGQLTTGTVEYDVRVTGEFTTEKEIAEVVIRANDAGNWLRVKDVADVRSTFEDRTRIAKMNGEEAVAMVVVKSELSDVITVTEGVRRVIDSFSEQLPQGMEITISNDFAYYVNRRLGVLKNNAIIGFTLVLFLLFLFLDPAPAFVTAFGIPIAVFITFIVMHIMNISINLVSMLGLIIVLGMLVDDGIIVAENGYRYIEQGLSPRDAAIRGTQEVIPPVTVTILTTFAAFAPLLFMRDILGKFIRELPIVVMVALAASLFEAFIILPAHLADFVRQKSRASGAGRRETHTEKGWFRFVKEKYTGLLQMMLNHRYLLIFGGLLPLLLMAIFIWKFHMKSILFTDEGIEQFYIRVEAKKGTPLSRMNELIVPLEELVASLPDSERESYRTYLGSIETERGFDPNARKGTHLGQVTVFLTPYQQRERTTREIADALRKQFDDIHGFERIYIFQPKPGPPVGRAVEIAVKGEDFVTLQEIAQKMTETLGTMAGVSDIETSYSFGKQQLRVRVDEAAAQQHYLTVAKIAASVRRAFKGGVATAIKPLKAEEEIDVVVRFVAERRDDRNAFDEILIPNRFGNLIPLKSVASVEEQAGIYQIQHQDGKRTIYVLADVDNEQITSLEVNRRMQEEFRDVSKQYLGYTLDFGGEFEQRQESVRNLVVAYAFALCMIVIILTAMFNSLIQPFIVMCAIPFGMIGVILAFFVHNEPLGFFGLMGVVGLTGIVVNDSIVLVDFINRLRQSGRERRASLTEAGQIRLRPVIMTSVTTIGGLVSVAYGIGGGDPFLKPMALAIVWGLVFSTFLTLVCIPCLYAIFDDFVEHVLHRKMVKDSAPTSKP